MKGNRVDKGRKEKKTYVQNTPAGAQTRTLQL